MNPKFLLSTELGDILIEIYLESAPVTAGNFLRYVDENRFENAVFYRTVRMDNQPNNAVKIEVIQGGLKDESDSRRLPSIIHETTRQTGLSHINGAISMARNEPGSASSEFFICIGDQPELDFGGKRNPDDQGFAVFGKVIQGLDVVKLIQQQETEGQYFLKDIKIMSVVRKND